MQRSVGSRHDGRGDGRDRLIGVDDSCDRGDDDVVARNKHVHRSNRHDRHASDVVHPAGGHNPTQGRPNLDDQTSDVHSCTHRQSASSGATDAAPL